MATAGHTMANGDNFWVVVENSDTCQTTSVSRTITVTAPPAVVLTTTTAFPGDVFCTGEDVDFIATNIGGATYEYEIGSGGRVAVGSSSFTIPYAQLAGTATVTVYVTSGGCESTDTVFVQENIISSAGTITGTQTICPGDTPTDLTSTAVATASGTISYVWEYQPVSQNPATDPWTRTSVTSVGYSFSGTISESTRFRRVTISNLDGKDCEETTSFVVVTLAIPPAVNFVNTTTTTICAGDTVSFEATAGGGGAPFNYEFYANGGITAVHSYTGTTSTLVTFDPVADAGLTLNDNDYFYVIVTDNSGCQTTSVSRTITVSAPAPVNLTTSGFFPNNTFCENDNVEFIATPLSGATYEYQIDTGPRVLVGSSTFTINYPVLSGGATVTVYVTQGSCVSTDTIFVEENTINDVGSIWPLLQTICNLEIPTDLTSATSGSASGTITYRWESRTASSSTWSPTGVSSLNYIFSSPLSISTEFRRVLISELPGGIICEESTPPVEVRVGSALIGGAVTPTTQTACENDTILLSVTGGSSGTYQWQYSTDNFMTSTNTTNIGGAQGATYLLTVTSSETRWYRRIVEISGGGGSSCQAFSSAFNLNVVDINPGTIDNSSSGTYCYGSRPAAILNSSLASSTFGAVSYQE